MKKKKDISPVISPSFGSHVKIAGMDLSNGVLSFLDANGEKIVPEAVSVGHGYKRDSGKIKIINQAEVPGDNINLNPNDKLKGFDWVFSIDTNNKEYKGKIISVSCSACIDLSFREIESRNGSKVQDWDAKIKMQDAFIFSNSIVNPEIVGWLELIERIKRSGEYNDELRIGIIVDSELDRLKLINRQEEPIIDKMYLPNNFELIYASSDIGQTFPQNKFIRICDKISNATWSWAVTKEGLLDGLYKNNNKYIDSSIVIKSDRVQKFLDNAT